MPQTDDWVPGVRYRPEPPVTVRGSMNPWETERQRVLYLAEQETWPKIQALQREYAVAYTALQAQIGSYNQTLAALEATIGKKLPIEKLTASPVAMLLFPAKMLPGLSQIFGMLTGLIGGLFGGKSKQRRVNDLMRDLEAAQAAILRLSERLQTMQSQVAGLVQTRAVIQEAQAVQLQQDRTASELFYQQRSAREGQQAAAHRERIQWAQAVAPSRAISYDAL